MSVAPCNDPDLFMAVHDTFLTDSADYADIVLSRHISRWNMKTLFWLMAATLAASALARLPR